MAKNVANLPAGFSTQENVSSNSDSGPVIPGSLPGTPYIGLRHRNVLRSDCQARSGRNKVPIGRHAKLQENSKGLPDGGVKEVIADKRHGQP